MSNSPQNANIRQFSLTCGDQGTIKITEGKRMGCHNKGHDKQNETIAVQEHAAKLEYEGHGDRVQEASQNGADVPTQQV